MSFHCGINPRICCWRNRIIPQWTDRRYELVLNMTPLLMISATYSQHATISDVSLSSNVSTQTVTLKAAEVKISHRRWIAPAYSFNNSQTPTDRLTDWTPLVASLSQTWWLRSSRWAEDNLTLSHSWTPTTSIFQTSRFYESCTMWENEYIN